MKRTPTAKRFLFAAARPIADYEKLVEKLPLLRDRPEEREPLLRLDSVLRAMNRASVIVPMPQTWVMAIDAPLPPDILFPLFLRTTETSWKKGGRISRVKNQKEFEAEAAELRRALGWDATVLAREWLDLASAGKGHYGPVPQEIRVWIIDGAPFAWSFHHMNIISRPVGLPPSEDDLVVLRTLAAAVGIAFTSRLVAADFARGRDGRWWFIEAGPGSCAGTGHEGVFMMVACMLRGEQSELARDQVGGCMY